MTSIPHLCVWNVTNLPSFLGTLKTSAVGSDLHKVNNDHLIAKQCSAGNVGTLQDYYTRCQKFKNLYHKDIIEEEEEEEVVSGPAKQKKCGLLYDAEHSLALKV